MNISWISIRDLEYIVAVAEHMHFGRAAQALHVSQPALSGQIKKIEQILGRSLFERTNRKVSLTPIGNTIYQQAQRVLEEAKKIIVLAKKSDAPLETTLRIGAIASLSPYLIPYLLAPVKKKFPNLKMILQEGLTDGLLTELRNGSLDIVFAAKTFSTVGLETFPLFQEEFLLAAPKQHPILKKNNISTQDLKTEEMVLLEDGHCLRDQTIEFCPVNRRGRIRQFHAMSIESLRHLVAAGHGYTLIPKLAAANDSRFKDLIEYRHFSQKNVARTIVLACRASNPFLEEIKLFADYIVEIMPSSQVTKFSKRS